MRCKMECMKMGKKILKLLITDIFIYLVSEVEQ